MDRKCSYCRRIMKRVIPGVYRCSACGLTWMHDKGYFKEEPGTEYYLAEATVQDVTVFVPKMKKPGEEKIKKVIELDIFEDNTPAGPYLRNADKIIRGGIYYIRKHYTEGSEQWAGRPGIVVSDISHGPYKRVVTIVYLTKREHEEGPTHIRITSTGKIATALVEQITTVDVSRIGSFMGRVSVQEMLNINEAILKYLGLANRELRILKEQEYIHRLEAENRALDCQLRELTASISNADQSI